MASETSLRFRVELEDRDNVYVREVVSRHRTQRAAETAAARAMEKKLDEGAPKVVCYIVDTTDEAHPWRWEQIYGQSCAYLT